MKIIFPLLGLLLASPTAFAHVVESHSGIASGLLHPLTGWDHALVMIGIGIAVAVNAKSNVKIREYTAATLVFALLVGSLVASGGWVIKSFESLITLSIAITGVVVMLGLLKKPLEKVTYMCTAAIAMVHGYTHLIEAPHSVGSMPFIIGVCISSIAIYYFGVACGKLTMHHSNIKKISMIVGSMYLLIGALVSI